MIKPTSTSDKEQKPIEEATGQAQPFSTLASMFARVSYNYAERYMFQATIRRDGSSNFTE